MTSKRKKCTHYNLIFPRGNYKVQDMDMDAACMLTRCIRKLHKSMCLYYM